MVDREKKRGGWKYQSLNSRKQRDFFRSNKKHFSQFLKDYHLVKKQKLDLIYALKSTNVYFQKYLLFLEPFKWFIHNTSISIFAVSSSGLLSPSRVFIPQALKKNLKILLPSKKLFLRLKAPDSPRKSLTMKRILFLHHYLNWFFFQKK